MYVAHDASPISEQPYVEPDNLVQHGALHLKIGEAALQKGRVGEHRLPPLLHLQHRLDHFDLEQLHVLGATPFHVESLVRGGSLDKNPNKPIHWNAPKEFGIVQ
jgi:hypothetical protein